MQKLLCHCMPTVHAFVCVYVTLLQAKWRAVLLLTSTRVRSGFALCSKNSEMQKIREHFSHRTDKSLYFKYLAGVFMWTNFKSLQHENRFKQCIKRQPFMRTVWVKTAAIINMFCYKDTNAGGLAGLDLTTRISVTYQQPSSVHSQQPPSEQSIHYGLQHWLLLPGPGPAGPQQHFLNEQLHAAGSCTHTQTYMWPYRMGYLTMKIRFSFCELYKETDFNTCKTSRCRFLKLL